MAPSPSPPPPSPSRSAAVSDARGGGAGGAQERGGGEGGTPASESWLGRGGGSGGAGAASAGPGLMMLIRAEKALIGSGGKSGNDGSCCDGGDCPSLAVGGCCFPEVERELPCSSENCLARQFSARPSLAVGEWSSDRSSDESEGNGGGVPLGVWLQVPRRASSRRGSPSLARGK